MTLRSAIFSRLAVASAAAVTCAFAMSVMALRRESIQRRVAPEWPQPIAAAEHGIKFVHWRQIFMALSLLTMCLSAANDSPNDWTETVSFILGAAVFALLAALTSSLPISILWRLWREYLPSLAGVRRANPWTTVAMTMLWLGGASAFIWAVA